jgi:hypothetical protein
MTKSVKILFLSMLILLPLFFLDGCGINDVERLRYPGRLKILLDFQTNDYQLTAGDSLYLQARDFKLYSDTNFADVFQNPEQFLPYEDSIVSFNMLEATRKDTLIQVAYGSVPPLEFDSLKFLTVPGETMILGGNTYPVSTNYSSLGGAADFSTVVKIESKIKIEENKTTTLIIHFITEENVFRYLDQFIYAAVVDTFFIK